ncbi:hypothetical protein GCM10010324_48730 [Streptomyces hiroshimensis]|uniref:Uncharacterized protein n=1 Tax=Streptomyces hiroshimensis TaxID=66424 RepID=A0ABQ2YVN8_9ACTN|nr:hypothetical protein GCM10010324_48730 [Streptomyces hiroshimensis]
MVEEQAAGLALAGHLGGHVQEQSFLLVRGELHASHLTVVPGRPGWTHRDYPEFNTVLTWGSSAGGQ